MRPSLIAFIRHAGILPAFPQLVQPKAKFEGKCGVELLIKHSIL